VIEDLIGFDPVTFLPVNINEGEITGLEMTGRTKLGEWDLASTLTLQDPVDSGGGPNNGNQLPRRAKKLFNIDADRGFGRFSAGASLRYQGDSYDDLANATELDAFVVVDLRGEYRINSHWAAGLALNNVLDEEYETAAYYNQPGANFLATLRYVPGN
jgi:vitamin B12 transporter